VTRLPVTGVPGLDAISEVSMTRRAWRGEVHASALPAGLKRVIIPVHIKETQREFRVLHQRRN
jgi:hypothetical protein